MSYSKSTAYGLESPRGTDWRNRAACRHTPDLFFNGTAKYDAMAIHVCLQHCPVLPECTADTQQFTPIGCVQAGVLWVETASRRGVSTMQPKEQEFCGPWCLEARREEYAS